jgi:hypothetical protein
MTYRIDTRQDEHVVQVLSLPCKLYKEIYFLCKVLQETKLSCAFTIILSLTKHGKRNMTSQIIGITKVKYPLHMIFTDITPRINT